MIHVHVSQLVNKNELRWLRCMVPLSYKLQGRAASTCTTVGI